jgi:hypothetical protein
MTQGVNGDRVTLRGVQKVYNNLDGQPAAPIQDVNAFLCP